MSVPVQTAFISLILTVCRFQDIVPISLYISIEVVRTLQAAFIYFDADMYYEKTKQATIARSWNLSDDLGQIEYIFSDKTGTLTQVCFRISIITIYCLSHTPLEFNGVQKVFDWGETIWRQ